MATPDNRETALTLHTTLVRLRAEAALIQRFNAGYGFADARLPSEVFLRDASARERLRRDSLRPQDTHIAQGREIADAIAEAERALEGHTSPLVELGDRLALDPAERALVAIAVAYELEPDVRDLCHTLAWGRPAALYADVCRDLAPELAGSRAQLGVLHPGGVLRRAGVVLVHPPPGGPRDSTLAGTVAVSRHILDWLFGEHRLDEAIAAFMTVLPRQRFQGVYLPDSVTSDIDRVVDRLGDRALLARLPGDREPDALPLVLIQGPPGAGKRAVAQALASRLGRPLALASVPGSLVAQAGAPLRDHTALDRALGEARLRRAVVYLSGIEALRAGSEGGASLDDVMLRQAAKRAIEEHDDLAIVATTERGMPSLPVARPFHLIRMTPANLETRRKAWSAGLAMVKSHAGPSGVSRGVGLSDDAADELASRYVIGPGVIADVIADASAFARATGEPVDRKAIEDAVGRRLTLRLGSFGTLITRKARLDEMVLPEDVVEAMGDMVAMVRERTQILERWGYSEHLGLSRGVSALFSGAPGTGKTMAASVLAGALGLELIRIDLSAVTSKWVGETEKHLAKIFDEAQSANAMLLFDEADSLFGKRTELKSAQDRYANLEVNYVLQRMETFDGISILTTNFESAIDQAFLRRLNFRVRFPEPEEDERKELWRRLLPPNTGIADQVDFQTLAERFEMTGGHIRNAIVRAAVVAARQGRAMEPKDLLIGAHHEYAEMGKVMPSLTR